MNGTPSVSAQPNQMNFKGLYKPDTTVLIRALIRSNIDKKRSLGSVINCNTANAARSRQMPLDKNFNQAMALINQGINLINQAKLMLLK